MGSLVCLKSSAMSGLFAVAVVAMGKENYNMSWWLDGSSQAMVECRKKWESVFSVWQDRPLASRFLDGASTRPIQS